MNVRIRTLVEINTAEGILPANTVHDCHPRVARDWIAEHIATLEETITPTAPASTNKRRRTIK